MKIVIVDDEAKTAGYLRQGLSEHGFTADVAQNGVDGRQLALETDYHLIVFDVMMPGLDGWSVLHSLRKRKDTPVIFLTARDRVEDRVKGLVFDANDHLVNHGKFSIDR